MYVGLSILDGWDAAVVIFLFVRTSKNVDEEDLLLLKPVILYTSVQVV